MFPSNYPKYILTRKITAGGSMGKRGPYSMFFGNANAYEVSGIVYFPWYLKITGFFISPAPEMALLHLKLDKVPKQFRPLIIQILTATRMLLSGKLTRSLMCQILSKEYKILPNITLAYTTNSTQKFYNIWNCWKNSFPIRDT